MKKDGDNRRDRCVQPERMGTVLTEVFSRLGLDATLSRQRVIAMWPEIVDARVAQHAQIDGIYGSVLQVRVDCAVWMNELAALKTTILEKVNAKLSPGAAPFTDIRFVQRSWAHAQAKRVTAPNREPPPPPPTAEDLAFLRETLQPLKDEQLRNLFARLIEMDRIRRHQRERDSRQHLAAD